MAGNALDVFVGNTRPSDRVLFAGEATNRHFPQTGTFPIISIFNIILVTGAFLSGLREAYRIFNCNNLEKKVKIEPKSEGGTTSEKRLSDSVPDARVPKARRRSDRSRLATSYVELDNDDIF